MNLFVQYWGRGGEEVPFKMTTFSTNFRNKIPLKTLIKKGISQKGPHLFLRHFRILCYFIPNTQGGHSIG